MRYLLPACLSLVILLFGCATSPKNGVSISSFRVVQSSPESVEIELVASNDGTSGDMCLGAIAKSKDGSVTSDGAFYSEMPVGQAMRITRKVMRPRGPGTHQTDDLVVDAIECGKQKAQVKIFKWSHVWPAIAPATTSVEQPAKDEDLGTTDPWRALLFNLEQNDFTAADALLDKWNVTRARDHDGAWKLDSLRNVLFYITQRSSWPQNLAKIEQWKRARPNSSWVVIAEAKYWAAYAWHIHGNCTDCKDVDPVAMQIFNARMRRAEQILMQAKGFAANNPLWYETYLEIAIDAKRDEGLIQKVFTDGIRQFPHFQPLYVAMAEQWTPLYGKPADWNKVEDLANQAVRLTSDPDGTSDYAWIYSQISLEPGIERNNLLQESMVSWPKMRDAFEELIKRYPGEENLNAFAAFACRANDKETYLLIRPRIQGHIHPERWPSNFSPDMCDHRYMQYS